MPIRFVARSILFLMLVGFASAVAAATYDVRFHGDFEPARGFVEASITVSDNDGRLEQLDFAAPGRQFSRFRGDGVIERSGDRVVWQVPPEGGRITFRARVNHKRGDAYDARMTRDWAMLRLDDLFPAARVETKDGSGARSRSSLTLTGPKGWRFESPYGPVDGPVATPNPKRRFDRPVGWLAAGRLGIRREHIAGRKIAVAAPLDQGFRRMDFLAFLNWTLPSLTELLPHFPERLLILGAADPMWRGGLSGPGSFYLHSDRPLLSENSTSTLLHELVHVGTVGLTADGDDWLAEGIAEYYSLVLLERSGTITRARYDRALDGLADWVEEKNGTLSDPSTSADTARAVLLFRDLDRELARAGSSLDAVARPLLAAPELNRQRLIELVEAELGGASDVLASALGDRSRL